MKRAVHALVLALGAVLLALPAAAGAKGGPPDKAGEKAQTTEIQILGLNDFHGNLEPPSGSGGRIGATNAGGVEYLAHTSVRSARRTRTRCSSRRET